METAVKGRAPRAAKAAAGTQVEESLRRGLARDLGEDFAPRRRTLGPVGARLREDEDYAPAKQLGGWRLRLRQGVPRSVVGRVLTVGAFVAVLGGAGFGLWTLRSLLLVNPRLVLESSGAIQITGNSHLTRAQMLTVFGEDVERNILTVSLAERRAMLERLPWVEHATVMRLLPNRFRVAIVERKPVAYVRQGSTIKLVDTSGVLLDMTSDGDASAEAGAGTGAGTHYSFPVLTGIRSEDPLSVRAARMRLFARFNGELGEKAKMVSEIDVSNPEDVKALIPDGSSDVLVHFGEKDFLHRLELYEKNLPGWKAAYPRLASADMRYERQVVLEMQPGAGVPASEKGVEEKKPVAPRKEEAKGVVKGPPVKRADAGDSNAPHGAASVAAKSQPPKTPNLGQPTSVATPPPVRQVPGLGAATTVPATVPPRGHLTQSFDVKGKTKPTQVEPQ